MKQEQSQKHAQSIISKIIHLALQFSLLIEKLSKIAFGFSIAALCGLCALVFALAIALNFSFASAVGDDLVLYLFTLLVLCGFAEALRLDSHVRLDLIYAKFSKKAKTRLNLFSNLFFIMPFCALLVVLSSDFTALSFRMNESSPNGHIPYYFLLKGLLIVGFFLLFLQSLAEFIKNLAVILGFEKSEDLLEIKSEEEQDHKREDGDFSAINAKGIKVG